MRTTLSPCYAYDVNSLYPLCLLNPFPIGPSSPVENPPSDQARGVAEITLSNPYTTIPPIPSKEGKQTRFQRGITRGIYTTPEIDYAKELGATVEVHQLYHFPT